MKHCPLAYFQEDMLHVTGQDLHQSVTPTVRKLLNRGVITWEKLGQGGGREGEGKEGNSDMHMSQTSTILSNLTQTMKACWFSSLTHSPSLAHL